MDYIDYEYDFEGGKIKDKLISIKENIQKRFYYFMIGITIGTIIIIIVNIIRKSYNKLSKNPQNTSCKNFKNTTLNIILTISVLINFYLIIPKQLYNYNNWQNKLEKIKEERLKRELNIQKLKYEKTELENNELNNEKIINENNELNNENNKRE